MGEYHRIYQSPDYDVALSIIAGNLNAYSEPRGIMLPSLRDYERVEIAFIQHDSVVNLRRFPVLWSELGGILEDNYYEDNDGSDSVVCGYVPFYVAERLAQCIVNDPKLTVE